MELLYVLVLYCAKAGMLHQLQRTFAPWKSGKIYFTYVAMIWLNVGFMIVSVAGVVFQCVPLQKVWDPTIAGYCVNRGAAIIVSAFFNFGIDVLILLLPLWSIYHLKKTVKYKLHVAAVFGLGVL